LRLVDATGRPRPAAIAAALLLRPRLMGELRRLGAASRLACRNLAQAVAWLLDEKTFRDNVLAKTGPKDR
jgi:hypothetical protein